jgi:hypothetical protein
MPSERIEPPSISHDDDRWSRHADPGECDYCGEHTNVMLEPFGSKPACRSCWELICYGEGE